MHKKIITMDQIKSTKEGILLIRNHGSCTIMDKFWIDKMLDLIAYIERLANLNFKLIKKLYGRGLI